MGRFITKLITRLAALYFRIPSSTRLWFKLFAPIAAVSAALCGIFVQYAFEHQTQRLFEQRDDAAFVAREEFHTALTSAHTLTHALAQRPSLRQAIIDTTLGSSLLDNIADFSEHIAGVFLRDANGRIHLYGSDEEDLAAAHPQLPALPDSARLVWQHQSVGRVPLLYASAPIQGQNNPIGWVTVQLDINSVVQHMSQLDPDDGVVASLYYQQTPFACADAHRPNWSRQACGTGLADTYWQQTWPLANTPPLGKEVLSARVGITSTHHRLLWQHVLVEAALVSIVVLLLSAAIIHLLFRSLLRQQQRSEQLLLTNTALTHTVHELKQTREEVVSASKLSSLGLVVAGVAHELNTPLAGAKLAVSNLNQLDKDHPKYQDKVDTCIAMTLNYIQRANRLVSRFKSVSVDRGNGQPRQIALKAWIDEQTDTLWLRYKHSPHRIINKVPEGLTMKVCPGVLSQVIDNLVDNAMTHAFNDTQQGRVTISALPQQQHTVIRVADNGKGIPKTVADKMYHPFYTTNREHGGSGLGLYICQQLVEEKLQGQILYTSVSERGTQFDICLPLTTIQPKN